jgi:hypothetical protein
VRSVTPSTTSFSDIVGWYAEEGRRAYGRVVPGRGSMRQIVAQEPVGIVANVPIDFYRRLPQAAGGMIAH